MKLTWFWRLFSVPKFIVLEEPVAIKKRPTVKKATTRPVKKTRALPSKATLAKTAKKTVKKAK